MENEYEFTEKQNVSFTKLAINLKLVSIALIMVGLATILETVIAGFDMLNFLGGMTWIIMGIVFYLPIDNFQNITRNKGNDIKELMKGLSELDKGWIFVLIVLSINKFIQLLRVASN